MSDSSITQIPLQVEQGDSAAVQQLLPHICDDLRGLARRMYRGSPADRTLDPTALVHEAYVRLVRDAGRRYESRQHFFRVAAMAMRQLLTDYARRQKQQTRSSRSAAATASA